MKEILITIDREGEIRLETRGYAGRQCLEASRPLELALGQLTSFAMTADAYQSVAAANKLRQLSGQPRPGGAA